MGVHLFDQYTLLHMAVGVIAYFWSVPFVLGLLVHVLFELVENTVWGMGVINTYNARTGLWPGGKYMADTLTNQTGDNLAFAGGWGLAWWLDTIGVKK